MPTTLTFNPLIPTSSVPDGGSATRCIHYSSFFIHHSSLSYTFSAKERDSETGLSYFGSRYYSSDLSIWLSVDPQSDKYASLSPYVYCADNPVKLVDPNGEEWDIDGYKYYPGQNCPDDAQQSTRDKWNAMNTIYSTKEGKDVIDYMNKEGVWYCVSSESCPAEIAGGQYVPDGNKTGGTIFLNGGSDIGTLAHEMFHGYQDQKGQGNASQHNELQARLFSDDITSQVRLITRTGLPQLQITEQGIDADLFNYNVGKVLSGGYSDNNMGLLENLFSRFKRFSAYKNLDVIVDGQTDLYGDLKKR